jgi:hypothetical protein
LKAFRYQPLHYIDEAALVLNVRYELSKVSGRKSFAVDLPVSMAGIFSALSRSVSG